MKECVLSLSGGMDSASLLIHLLSKDYKVTCLSFDYGQKHKIELDKAIDLVKYLNDHRFLNEGIYPKITHQIIKLDGLSNLLNSNLVKGGKEIPQGHYSEESMKDTVVPNRNKIFSSIIQAVALSIANKTKTKTYIAMGIHAGDHAIYPDCTQQFRDMDYLAFKEGNWNSELIEYYTPYIQITKTDVLQDGINSCYSLGLDYKEIYKRTNTSYSPISIDNKWVSDYKSGSSVERIESFIKLNLIDPIEYAEEDGTLVSWDKVRSHVIAVCNNYKNKS